MNVEFLAAVEDVLIRFQCFDNRQEFLLHDSVIALSISQFVGVKGHRFVILHDNGAKLIVAGIGIDVKGFVRIRISQEPLARRAFICLNARLHSWVQFSVVCFGPPVTAVNGASM